MPRDWRWSNCSSSKRPVALACPPDLAGLDLEVRNGVGASAVGQDQVAVELVGVGASRGMPDEDVADPDCARLHLQRPLGDAAAAAMRNGVIDEQPMLEVLPASEK